MAEILKPVPQEDLKLAEKSEDSIHSGSHDAAAIEHNPALDRKLLWRRDLVLIPIMGVLYMLLFLDRTNIANVSWMSCAPVKLTSDRDAEWFELLSIHSSTFVTVQMLAITK